MTTDRIQIFLENFLGLYGVDKVEITNVNTDKIYGVATYLNENEKQEFCWHMAEHNIASDDLIQLIGVIKNNKFNRTDKILVTADTIFKRSGWLDREKFNSTYDKLFEIEVKMIDDGEETDSYFIHD